MTISRTLASGVLLLAFTSSSPVIAKPDKPPPQAPGPDDEQGPPQPAYGQPPPGYPPPAAYPPPAYGAQAAPPAGVKGFSQRQKECRIQVRCPQDPTKPCPPCAGL